MYHWKADECSGNVLNDVGPNKHVADIDINASGSVTSRGTCGSGDTSESWNNGTNGKYGSSINLDGTDDYIDVDNPDIPEDAFTYAMWINVDDNTDETLVYASDAFGGNEVRVYLDDGIIRFSTNGTTRITTELTIAANEWTHVAVTRDDSGVHAVYINGIKDPGTATHSSTLDFSSCDLLFGVDADSACESSLGNYLDGDIDDIRVYNYALSEQQVINVMNLTPIRFE